MLVNKCNKCTGELRKDSIISKNKSFVNLSDTPSKKCKYLLEKTFGEVLES